MTLAVLWSLIRDTFRQGLASGVFWLVLGVTAICTLFCLSVDVTGAVKLDRQTGEAQFLPSTDPLAADPEQARKAGVDVVRGEVSLGFGVVKVQLGRDARDAVHFIIVVLGGGVAGAAGVLLMLVWTSGFLPSFLEPSNAAVLLAKPVPRWGLLLGKFIGILAYVLFHASVFVFATWFALGLKTGEWVSVYLWSIPLVLLQFSAFASVSLILAVLTRSVVVCIFGSVVFWFMCWGINYGRHALLLLPDLQNLQAANELPEQERVQLGFAMRIQTLAGSLTAAPAGPNLGLLRETAALVQSMQAARKLAQPRPRTGLLTELGYWLMPKPADLNMVFFDALNAHQFYAEAIDLRRIRELQNEADRAGRKEFWYRPTWSILSSLLFNVIVLGAAIREFGKIDY